MKQLIQLALLFVCIAAKAQTIPNTLSVSGSVKVERKVTQYKAKVLLNMDQVLYSNPEYKTLDDLKNAYFNMLRTKSFDTSKFKEDELSYLTYGYQKEGTVYFYETTNPQDIKTLSFNRINGITVYIQVKAEVEEGTLNKLLKTAFANAKENATRLASAANKKVGDIQSMSETYFKPEIWNSYNNDYEEFLTVSVSYFLE